MFIYADEELRSTIRLDFPSMSEYLTESKPNLQPLQKNGDAGEEQICLRTSFPS